MTAEQQLALIMQVLQAGTGASMMAPPSPGLRPGHEMYRAVASPAGMWEQVRGFAGPFIGSQFLGMQNPVTVPQVAPAQSIAEAWYTSRVTSRQWELTQQRALYDVALGMSHDAGNVLNRLGMPQMLGMSTREFQKLTDRVTSSAGMALAGQLVNLPAMQELMGGNVMATYQQMFANRHLFGQMGVGPMGVGQTGVAPIHPMDRRGQDWMRRVSSDVARSISTSIRGTPEGGVGMLPHFEYTRGFRDEQISDIAVAARAGGRWGDLSERLLAVGEGSDRYHEEISKVSDDIGQANRMFESLGDLMGSRDMEQLMGTLDKLTQGKWPQMDWHAVNASLRQMGATAQILNVSKGEMVNTVMSMQGVMQAATGVSPNQVAMGMTGGGLTGLASSAEMAQHVYSVAFKTRQTRPQDIQRIAMQQAGLMTMGLGSSAGRATQLIEYLNQQNAVDPALYRQYSDVMAKGSVGERRSMIDEVLSRSFGSAAEGRRRMDDPMFMRMVRESLSDESGRRVKDLIRNGQSYEWGERVEREGRRRLNRRTRDMRREAGLQTAADPEAVAEQQYKTAIDHMERMNGAPEEGDPDYAAKMQRYEAVQAGVQKMRDQFNGGETKVRGYQQMINYMKQSGVLSGYVPQIEERAAHVKAVMDSEAMDTRYAPAQEMQVIMKNLRNSGAIQKMSGEQSRVYEQIQLRMQADPATALKELDTFVTTLSTPRFKQDELRTNAAGELDTGIVDRLTADEQGAYQRIQELRKTDPVAAAKEMGTFMESLSTPIFDENDRKLLDEDRRQEVKRIAEKQEAGRAERTGYERITAGRATGTHVTLVEKQQETITAGLANLKDKFGTDGEQEARDQFQAAIASMRGTLSPEDFQNLMHVGKEGKPEEIERAMKFQGLINISDIARKTGTMVDRGIPVDIINAIYDQGSAAAATGQVRQMAAGLAKFDQFMGDVNPQQRATLSQLGLMFAEGSVDLQGLLGIQEGAVDYTKEYDPELHKELKQFGEDVGIDGLKKKLEASREKGGKASEAYDKLIAAADKPEEQAKMGDVRERLLQKVMAEDAKPMNRDDMVAYLAQEGVTGTAADKLATLAESYQERSAAQEKFQRDFNDKAPDESKLLEWNQRAARVNRKADRAKRKQQRQAMEVIEQIDERDGAGFVQDMEDKKYWKSKNIVDRWEYEKALKVLVPKARKGETRAQTAAELYRTDQDIGNMNPKQLEALKKIAEIKLKHEGAEAGKAGGGHEKRMRIIGTLQLVDKNNRKVATVNMDSREAYG